MDTTDLRSPNPLAGTPDGNHSIRLPLDTARTGIAVSLTTTGYWSLIYMQKAWQWVRKNLGKFFDEVSKAARRIFHEDDPHDRILQLPLTRRK